MGFDIAIDISFRTGLQIWPVHAQVIHDPSLHPLCLIRSPPAFQLRLVLTFVHVFAWYDDWRSLARQVLLDQRRRVSLVCFAFDSCNISCEDSRLVLESVFLFFPCPNAELLPPTCCASEPTCLWNAYLLLVTTTKSSRWTRPVPSAGACRIHTSPSQLRLDTPCLAETACHVRDIPSILYPHILTSSV